MLNRFNSLSMIALEFLLKSLTPIFSPCVQTQLILINKPVFHQLLTTCTSSSGLF